MPAPPVIDFDAPREEPPIPVASESAPARLGSTT